jgi:hypothetical protein
MAIFFMASGAGVIFLLYALAHFWREGRRTNQESGEHAPEKLLQKRRNVLPAPQSVSASHNSGASVISFQPRKTALEGNPDNRSWTDGTKERSFNTDRLLTE